MADMRRDSRCNFCGKRQDQVRKLVAGPGVFICDGCIELCSEVLREDNHPSAPGTMRGRIHTTRRTTFAGWFRNLFRVYGYTP